MKTAFDDYGRPISLLNANVEVGSRPVNKIVKATPKIEVQNDTKSGVQKFRVKLLAEAGGQSNTDVLCQIGLDGIRMLDPASGRTLRIYPLDMLTKWEVLDSFIFAFWAKSSIDIEPRCIRLQSNNYTVNIILDTLTASSVQVGTTLFYFSVSCPCLTHMHQLIALEILLASCMLYLVILKYQRGEIDLFAPL
ncbi:unnamed protein product, partial [Vitis vinifera]